MALILHIDGGSRGNPGPAAAGVLLQDDHGQSLLEGGFLLGTLTNNQAEYSALVLGLRAASRVSLDRPLSIFSDSELLVRQLLGNYRVKSHDLKPLFEDAQRLLLQFKSWTIQHIPREDNEAADALVNSALDCDEDVVNVQVGDLLPTLTPRSETSTKHSKPTAPPLPLPTSFPDQRKNYPVVVRVEHAPTHDPCSVSYPTGTEFTFEDVIPAGLCIHAAAAVLNTVVQLQQNSGSSANPSVSVKCTHPNCQAVFKIAIKQPLADSQKDH